MDLSLSILQEMVRKGKPGMLQLMGSQRVRHNVMTEQKKLIKSVESHSYSYYEKTGQHKNQWFSLNAEGR